jgi:hypothetical protein
MICLVKPLSLAFNRIPNSVIKWNENPKVIIWIEPFHTPGSSKRNDKEKIQREGNPPSKPFDCAQDRPASEL